MDKDMFSGLGQILKPAVRQAEETDAHLYLQKHERDQQRKKRDQENDKDDYFDTEDRASVSVDALYAFISNMIAESESKDSGKTIKTPTDQPLHALTPSSQEHQNSKTAKAAGAYAHAAETGSANTTQIPQRAHAEKTGDGKNAMLYDLLKEIEILKARNVQDIYIEKAATFKESLINAIMHAKAQ